MGTLPPTPNLGLILPNPGTGEPHSTAAQNGWFTTIDDAVGDLWGMADPVTQRLRSTQSADPSLSGTGHALQLGASGVANLAFGDQTVQARDNGAAAELKLNPLGGKVSVGRAPYHAVVPSTVAVSGGSASIDADGFVSFSAVGSMRLQDVFAGYTGFDGFEFFIEMNSSPAPGSSQPFFLGLAGGATTRSALRSAWRAFQDPATATLLFGGSGTDTSDANIGLSGNLAYGETMIHGIVSYAAGGGNNTLVQYEASTASNGGQYVSGYVYNTAAAVDDGLRFGRGGSGVVSGRMYVRRIINH